MSKIVLGPRGDVPKRKFVALETVACPVGGSSRRPSGTLVACCLFVQIISLLQLTCPALLKHPDHQPLALAPNN